MKAKQKAEYLYNQMYNQKQIGPEAAKQCALIAVDEVLNTIMSVYQPETKEFWYKVKQEIEAL